MTLYKIRCGTPTIRGVCNRWQFEVSLPQPDGLQYQYRCSHCKQVTLVWSSQLTAQAAVHGVR